MRLYKKTNATVSLIKEVAVLAHLVESLSLRISMVWQK